MKYIRIYESFAEDRAIKRRRDEFDQLSDATKRRRYDAKVQLKKIQAKYPDEKFSIIDYYSGSKCVFLSEESGLLNMWVRDNRYSNYTDGLNKDFASWLEKNNYSWSWHSPEGRLEWDGITITPKDFEGLYWYYGGVPLVIKNRDGMKIQKSALEVAEIFKQITGLDVYPAEVKSNYVDSSDRNVLEIMMTDELIEDIIMRRNADKYNL